MMVEIAQERLYIDEIPRLSAFFLAADIGGTNSNFGVFMLNHDKPLLILSLHYKSKKIVDFTEFFKQVIDYLKEQYAIVITACCIGAAGVIYPHRVTAHPTNLMIEINVHECQKATGIKEIFLINDFEAVAFGLDLLDETDIEPINKNGIHRFHANRAFLGAGTGLGKSIMTWHREEKRYYPTASEGGHADAVFYDNSEQALHSFIKKMSYVSPISWEHVLSGAGIQKIYAFLGATGTYPITEITREIEQHDFNPDRISYFAQRDQRCADTFKWYVKLYARCAKNFALDALSLNGLYIAGGIAAKNLTMFHDPLFMQEFTYNAKQSRELFSMPVYVIANYDVSLYGAVVAARLLEQEKF